MSEPDGPIKIDAKTFQVPLEKLGETLVQKLMREGAFYQRIPKTYPKTLQ
jgi:hypothetical protein